MSHDRLLVNSIVAIGVIGVLTGTLAFCGEPAGGVADGPLAHATAAGDPGRDWPLFRGDPRSTGVARTTLPDQPVMLWKHQVPKGSFEGTPAIVDGVVYIGDLDGSLYALQLATGEPKWTYKTESGFMASPAVRNGLLYIGDIDGRFRCLEAATGKPMWEFDSDAEIDSSANFFRDNVLFGSQDATLYCLDAKGGKLVWKYAIADQIRCTPTVVEDRCFVAGCDGRLHVIDLNKGQEAASVEIGGAHGRDAGRGWRSRLFRHRKRDVFLHRLEAGEGGLDL